ncbi:hypothetical protein MAIT1_00764 [Magnetofaba australis IT-1]|uniref:DUF1643 domain-containing protein n=1 Tax=Magnetofaba australis IT-1 TaxID=1434232 RepID=A0A1Y2K1T0_9PROT|nr:hypothetical protein MAIT1_00764 [Magnetofaba australis IT-1]
MINFLLLNPSTADEAKNDPTVERCERYARAWGYGTMLVTNVFAYRATDPARMKAFANPVGPGNNQAILTAARMAQRVVAAWGNHAQHLQRSDEVRALLERARIPLYCLNLNRSGEPVHPLYQRKDLQPRPLPPAK